MSFLFSTNTASAPAQQSMVEVPVGLTADARKGVPAKDSKDSSVSSDVKLTSIPTGLVRSALRMSLGKSSRVSISGRHADVYPVSLNLATGITSDASGNGLAYFNVAGFVSAGRWASLYPLFDLMRVKKVVFHFVPWLGVKTSRALIPATGTAPLIFRCAMDPDGALSAPSVTQINALQSTEPHYARTWPVYESKSYTYVPKPLLRIGGSALTKTTLAEWHDTVDVNSNYATSVVGGIICGNVATGSFPASTNVYGMFVEYHLEFAGLV